MPVSNLGWNQVSTPVYEAFHRKRKLSNEFSMEVQAPDEGKRKCTNSHMEESLNWPLNTNHKLLSSQDPTLNNNHTYLNSSNVLTRTPCDTPFQQNTESMQEISNMQQDTEFQNPISPCIQKQLPKSQQLLSTQDHIMDLCDETYPTITVKNTNGFLNNDVSNHMESESNTKSEPPCTDYCGILSCVGGDKSPRSGNVRCFCRPFWDGLVEMVPYVSDYY